MKKLIKEPLLHFLVLGALIFAYYDWVSGGIPDSEEILITRGDQQHLLNIFARTWQRPPTTQEFEGLLQDHIRNEIAYREGVAMGFDQGDTIIRRRMRQKLELLTDEIVALAEPTDNELGEFLQTNPELFRLDPRFDLRLIYFSKDQRGNSAHADALTLLERLKQDPSSDWTTMGDPWLLPNEYRDTSFNDLERQMGESFTEAVQDIEPGEWTGPVTSGYGLHLVIVDSRIAGRDPGLDEVRDLVRTQLMNQRRLEATDQMYRGMAEKYSIEIEPFDGAGEM
jgi:hypothetical protein